VRSRRLAMIKSLSTIDRPLVKGELIVRRSASGSAALHIVIEVRDTHRPRYGTSKDDLKSEKWGGTRLAYKVINPSTGKEISVSETELAAEWELTST